MKYVPHRGKMHIKKWVFRDKMGAFGLEKNRTSNQTRKAKWCKTQVQFSKVDNKKGVKG